MTKDELKKQYNLTEEQFLGTQEIGGHLNLSSLTSIPEGFNPTVGGYLDLDSLTSIPEGFNPTVGGNLYLESVTSIPKGFNPTVGEDLDLRNLTSIPKGFNPTVGGTLYLNNLTSIPKGFSPIVGRDLYLNKLTSIPEGFSPIVGRDLYLNNLTSIPEGFNPTVGGYLDLNNLTSISEGFNPTVGGDLYLTKLTTNFTKLEGPITWSNGKYIKVDGLFTEILSKKGNIYKVKKLNNPKEFFLITDGNNKGSHGDTLKQAKEDLIYKISNISKDQYKGLTLQSTLSFEKAIECYRVITGACSFGTKDFVTSNNIEAKDYSIQQIIELIKDKYGNETFIQFFS